MYVINLHVLQYPRDASSFPTINICVRVGGVIRGQAGCGSRTLDCVQSRAVMLTEGCSPHWWVHSGPNAQHGVHFSRELQSEWSTSLTPQQGGNEERKGGDYFGRHKQSEVTLSRLGWTLKQQMNNYIRTYRLCCLKGQRYGSGYKKTTAPKSTLVIFGTNHRWQSS